MRALILASTLIATFAVSSAWAQSPAPPLISQFMSHKDIMALIDKAKADRKPNAPVTAEPILLLAPIARSFNIVPATRLRPCTQRMLN